MFIMKCLLSINSMENNEPIIRSIKPSAVSLKQLYCEGYAYPTSLTKAV
ncbi:MAG: hypothetical protein IKY75_03965 [Bacteroidaceae bacterium]|nr:hypothetical protein [Bacteroidaceae bacterium]